MEKQTDMFEIDHTGRKAAKLGLSHDHEVVVEIIDEARRLHSSLTRYQIGIVDCEMKRLSNADRATELTRLWNDTFTAYSNLGGLLTKYQPIDAGIEGAIQAEVAAEKTKKDESDKLGNIDDEFKKFMGGDGPKSDAEDDQDEEAA